MHVVIEKLGTVTNGDIIKAMFPSVEVKEHSEHIWTNIDVGTVFSKSWWNSPYKGSDKELIQ